MSTATRSGESVGWGASVPIAKARCEAWCSVRRDRVAKGTFLMRIACPDTVGAPQPVCVEAMFITRYRSRCERVDTMTGLDVVGGMMRVQRTRGGAVDGGLWFLRR